MKKENCKWHNEWDYVGYIDHIKNKRYPDDFYQNDWNQTLLTKINQVSAMICKASYRGGANTIEINSKLLPLFKTLEYYDSNHLVGRYIVIVNNDLEDNTVFMYYHSNDIPIFTNESISDDSFDDFQIKIKSECDENIVKEYEFTCSGYIEILNYKTNIE